MSFIPLSMLTRVHILVPPWHGVKNKKKNKGTNGTVDRHPFLPTAVKVRTERIWCAPAEFSSTPIYGTWYISLKYSYHSVKALYPKEEASSQKTIYHTNPNAQVQRYNSLKKKIKRHHAWRLYLKHVYLSVLLSGDPEEDIYSIPLLFNLLWFNLVDAFLFYLFSYGTKPTTSSSYPSMRLTYSISLTREWHLTDDFPKPSPLGKR